MSERAPIELVTFVMDHDANVVAWTESAERLFGFSATEVVGRGFWLFCEHSEAVRCAETLQRALGHGDSVETREFRRKDGTSFHGTLSFTPAGDEVVAAIATTQTSHQETTNWLLASLAHDLRQPITVVQTAAYVIKRRLALADWIQPLVDRISNAASLLADMTEDLLDAGSVRLGAPIGLDRSEVDLEEMLAELVSQLRLTRPHPEIAVTVDGPVAGNWDRRRVWRILQNLIENAVVHSISDAPVRISSYRNADGVVCTVENKSTPIAPDMMARLFEPFQRGSGRGRIGLGLHIARELARAHGGDVTVWCQQDSVVFTLFLPSAPPVVTEGISKLRRHPRIPFDRSIEVRVGTRSFAVAARDISRRGLCFYSDGELTLREQIRIAVPSPAGSFSMIGTVRHVAVAEGGRSRVGVEFLLDLSSADIEGLTKPGTN
jgi:PAS domain S-box-containing protein